MQKTDAAIPQNAERYLRELHARLLERREGEPASYIPQLRGSDPDVFAVGLATTGGERIAAGDAGAQFTLQSTSKPFTYGLALERVGTGAVRQKVGVEPTGDAFNSILQLEEQVHRPYNPMINAGAIAVAGLLHDACGAKEAINVAALSLATFAGRELRVNQEVLESELTTGDRNRAIAHLLRHFGVIEDIEGALTLYLRQCATEVTVEDLALMGATLANGGVNPATGQRALAREHVRDVLALMFTCGMYDSAGRWAYAVGLPAKSGVSGAIVVVVPGRMGLATYSPRLDRHGHSLRGIAAFEGCARDWGLGLFG